jgi:ABC-2 type transport system permease protein
VIAVELYKLYRRPRTWVSLGLLVGLPTMVAIFLATTRIATATSSGPPLLQAVLGNGQLFPAAALAIVLPVFLPVAVAIIGGDSVAGEASNGTLRYLLVRPVGRTRLLLAKLVTMIVYVLGAVILVAGAGYLLGRWLFPVEPATGTSAATGLVTSVSGPVLTPAELATRMAGAVLYVAVSMLGVGAIAMFLSTLSESALGATLGALAALVASQLLDTLDAAEAIRPYLPTRYWLAWIDLFREPILWRNVERGLGIQLVYVVVFLGAAWANLATRDVKS